MTHQREMTIVSKLERIHWKVTPPECIYQAFSFFLLVWRMAEPSHTHFLTAWGYWSFNFSISASNGHLGLIFFRMEWLDLLAVRGILKDNPDCKYSSDQCPHPAVCGCVQSRFSHVRFFATLWTVTHQAPLSMGFSRQEYWSCCLALLLVIIPTQGSNPHLFDRWVLCH